MKAKLKGLGLLVAMTAATSYAAETVVNENFETGFDTTNRIDVTTAGEDITGGYKLKGLADGYVSIIDHSDYTYDTDLGQRDYHRAANASSLDSLIADYGTNVIQVKVPNADYTDNDGDLTTVPQSLIDSNIGAVIDLGTDAGAYLSGLKFDYQKLVSDYYQMAILYSSDNGSTWKNLYLSGNLAVWNTADATTQKQSFELIENIASPTVYPIISDVDQIRIVLWNTNNDGSGADGLAYAIDNLEITTLPSNDIAGSSTVGDNIYAFENFPIGAENINLPTHRMLGKFEVTQNSSSVILYNDLNSTGADQALSYKEYIADATGKSKLTKGATYSFEFTNNSNTQKYFSVIAWADWDGDGRFEDGERVELQAGTKLECR